MKQKAKFMEIDNNQDEESCYVCVSNEELTRQTSNELNYLSF